MKTSPKKIVAIDIELPADTPLKSSGTAYYRLDPKIRDFFKLCRKDHEIMGFEWDGESLNFGVILVHKDAKK